MIPPVSDGEFYVMPDGRLTFPGLKLLRQIVEEVEGLEAGMSGGTDLGYTPATRLLTSSTGADVTLPLVGANPGLMSAADKTKLDGVASGATVNATDAALRDRATHTGTQAAATIVDLAATVQSYTLDLFADPVTAVNFNGQEALSFRIENRTSDPGSPAVGQIWLRTDL